MPNLYEAFKDNAKSKCVVFQYVLEVPRAKEALIIDAAVRRTHISRVTPTDSPVELGSKISDHVDIAPKEFQVEGVISNSPITLVAAAIGNIAGVAGGFVGRNTNSLVGAVAGGAVGVAGGLLMNKSGAGRIQKAYQTLLELQDKAIPINVVEKLRSYENMIITDLTVDRDANTADSLFFRATLREIRIVSNELVNIPKGLLDKAVGHSATSTVDQGQQSPPESEEPGFFDKLKSKSILKILAN